MKDLSKQELQKIYGGGISWSAIGIISVIVTFLIGAIDGYVRPLPCNEE